MLIAGLAGLLRATNPLAEAEPLYHRALAIDKESEHPTAATDLNNCSRPPTGSVRPRP